MVESLWFMFENKNYIPFDHGILLTVSASCPTLTSFRCFIPIKDAV
jgi:hypothetical protein